MTDKPTFPLLLASSVHDIKNSVGVLLETVADLAAATDTQDAAQRQRLATLQAEASRINGELMQMLGIYRLQNELLPVRLEQVLVADLLADQVAHQRLLFDMRNIEAEVICDDALTACCDPGLVAGIVQNALVNAVRHARGTVIVRAAEADADGGVAIAVEDDGDGFPAAMLGDANPASGMNFATGSSRLGLYFAREIARRHRRGSVVGHIELDNRPGGGARFSLFIP